MKSIAVGLILIFSLTASAQDQSVKWHTDLMTAIDLSIKKDMPLFLFFTGSDWCGWCKRLQNEVFIKPEFETWAKKNAILVELDFPRRTALSPELQRQNMELAQLFGVRGYPTVWFVTPARNGNEINFNKLGSTGYVAGGPKAWIEAANSIIQ